MSKVSSGDPRPDRRSVSVPGRRVGVTDVARAAGVSASTVSNVLNHPERVNPTKREKVEVAMRRLGYVQNAAARHLRTGSSRTLGLLLLDAWNPFFTEMARGVEDYALAHDRVVLISNSAREPEREARYLTVFAERRADGLLLVPIDRPTEQLAALRRDGIPSVLLDYRDTGDESMSVSLDDVRGGELAMGHLLECGHRDVMFAGDPHRVTQVKDRLLGATRAISAAGAPVRLDVTDTPLTVAGGRLVAERLLDRPVDERPSAVFASSDPVAIGILQTLLRCGVRVPEDVALVGYDDSEFAAQVAVPLTSIRQPPYEMGRTGARMLLEQIDGTPPGTRHVVFQPELVVRESTRPDP